MSFLSFLILSFLLSIQWIGTASGVDEFKFHNRKIKGNVLLIVGKFLK